jgi:hypothetical protein
MVASKISFSVIVHLTAMILKEVAVLLFLLGWLYHCPIVLLSLYRALTQAEEAPPPSEVALLYETIR